MKSFGPGGDDPVNNVRWLHATSLTANAWNPNYVLGPELRLLAYSILTGGWIQPLLVSKDKILIDGFHRWRLSQDDAEISARYQGYVPCAVLNVLPWQAMLMTVRVNRAKGTAQAVRTAALVREVIDTHGVDPDVVAREIGAHRSEVDLLYQDDLFAARVPKGYRYSQSWTPERTNAPDHAAGDDQVGGRNAD